MKPALNFLTTIEDWSEKYQAIMDFGRELLPLDLKLKTIENKISGCQSRVWLNIYLEKGFVIINGEADSRLVQGLLAIIIEIYKEKTLEEVIETDQNWVKELGLDTNISLVRRAGIKAIIDAIRDRTLVLVSK